MIGYCQLLVKFTAATQHHKPMTDTPQHFLSLLDLDTSSCRKIIERAIELKQMHRRGVTHTPMLHKSLAMIFEKSSTRTRVSFESGMARMGGHALFLTSNDTQLGRGEPIADSARVISRMCDLVMIRTFAQETVAEFAKYSSVPVINALTDLYHPCQLLADMQTWLEQRGDMSGKTAAWVGDGNNMCHSYINAAIQFDFKLNIACPEGYDPDAEIVAAAGDRIKISRQPASAIEGADLVVTDVWTSMGQEQEQQQRLKAFKGYCIDDQLMSLAADDAIFMHCLPAHRDEEVTASVLEGSQSVVWDEAENRLHAQNALMEFLLS